MSRKWFILFLAFISAGAIAYGLSGQDHNFSEDLCNQCHDDAINNPSSFKPEIADACNKCHPQLEEKKSHPSDTYPTMSIPKDMPLVEGRLNCVTCHYVHPKENIQFFVKNHNYLRRNVKGVFFCLECHTVDKKGHIVLEKVHIGSYKVTDSTVRIDQLSLECIVCHDSHMKADVDSLGAGTWDHFNQKFNHTIGVSYKYFGMRNINKFKPLGSMSREIRLYDGKVGCGTCHNIYSKEKNMLVISNANSNLCIQCHNN